MLIFELVRIVSNFSKNLGDKHFSNYFEFHISLKCQFIKVKRQINHFGFRANFDEIAIKLFIYTYQLLKSMQVIFPINLH